MVDSAPTSWTFGTILDALGDLVVEARGDRSAALTGATADSREIKPGDCFVAVRGYQQDGIRYWPAAQAAGAEALVCETCPDPLPEVPFARVRDGYAAMGRVAELVRGRPADAMQLIGITGTNGKTTCAFLLDRMLEAAGRCTGMIGTVVYKFGDRSLEADRTTPMPFALQDLLLDMRSAGVDTVTVEVSSHSLAQRRLGTAKFAAGLFTNLTGDHLDYHRTMEDYYAAKRRLFTEDLLDGAPAVVNVDDPHGERLHAELRREGRVTSHSFSMTDRGADFALHSIQTNVAGGGALLAYGGENHVDLPLRTPMIGRYNLCNVGCVAALALVLGVPPETVARCAAEFHGAPGRLQPIRKEGWASVFVDYAHTDDALENVLQSLAAEKKRELILVFGCGGDRDPSKRPRMARTAETYADRIYVTSDNPRTEDPEAILDDVCAGFSPYAPFHRYADRGEAIRAALAEADPADIVLIAGKGHETYQEINGVKHPFDDACEVRKALSP